MHGGTKAEIILFTWCTCHNVLGKNVCVWEYKNATCALSGKNELCSFWSMVILGFETMRMQMTWLLGAGVKLSHSTVLNQ